MVRVKQTTAFAGWLAGLRDVQARARIAVRIGRIEDGNQGDVSPVGDGIVEFRIHYGPGYRLYGKWSGAEVVILLCGGDKGSQDRDIQRAKAIAKEMRL